MEDYHHDYRKSTQEIYLPKSLFQMLIHLNTAYIIHARYAYHDPGIYYVSCDIL
jgi:hypothetical protein